MEALKTLYRRLTGFKEVPHYESQLDLIADLISDLADRLDTLERKDRGDNDY